jgi:hypothetical protein
MIKFYFWPIDTSCLGAKASPLAVVRHREQSGCPYLVLQSPHHFFNYSVSAGSVEALCLSATSCPGTSLPIPGSGSISVFSFLSFLLLGFGAAYGPSAVSKHGGEEENG